MNAPERRCRPPPAKILRLIVDHQRWLNSNGRFGKRLEEEELSVINCDLDGVDLSGADLNYAYFDGGSVRGVRFVGTDLSYSTFKSCDIEGADFSRANLAWATLATNHEKAASFEGANLLRTAWTAEEGERNFEECRREIRASFDRLKEFDKLRKPPQP